jgi:hypothetical protein
LRVFGYVDDWRKQQSAGLSRRSLPCRSRAEDVPSITINTTPASSFCLVSTVVTRNNRLDFEAVKNLKLKTKIVVECTRPQVECCRLVQSGRCCYPMNGNALENNRKLRPFSPGRSAWLAVPKVSHERDDRLPFGGQPATCLCLIDKSLSCSLGNKETTQRRKRLLMQMISAP